MENTTPLEQDEASPGDLQKAVNEFNSEAFTPELATKTWQTIWHVWGERAGLNLKVTDCDRSQKEIREIEKKGNTLIFIPEEVAKQKNRHLLAKIFPDLLRGRFLGAKYIKERLEQINNAVDQIGWLDIETSVDSPNSNINEQQQRELFNLQARSGQNLNIYIVGSQAIKLLYGYNIDQIVLFPKATKDIRVNLDRNADRVIIPPNTPTTGYEIPSSTRLLESSGINACFWPDGGLMVLAATPRSVQNAGARSAGTKKT